MVYYADLIIDNQPVSHEELRRIPKAVRKELDEKYQLNNPATVVVNNKEQDLRDRKAALANDPLFIEYIRKIRQGAVSEEAPEQPARQPAATSIKPPSTNLRVSILSEKLKPLFTLLVSGEVKKHGESLVLIYRSQQGLMLEPNTLISINEQQEAYSNNWLVDIEHVFEYQGAIFAVGKVSKHAVRTLHHPQPASARGGEDFDISEKVPVLNHNEA